MILDSLGCVLRSQTYAAAVASVGDPLGHSFDEQGTNHRFLSF